MAQQSYKMDFHTEVITISGSTIFYYDDFYTYSYDYDYSGGDVCGPESSMLFDSIFIPVLYSLALVVGLVGNGLVLVVLWKKRMSWNVTDIFILHLSLADVLLLLTLPLWAVEAVKGWSFGTGLCKLTGALFTISLHCGVFMLVCISLDLYLSVIHAVQMKPKVIHCCCLTVWIFCLLLSIPKWMFLQVFVNYRHQDKTECASLYPSNFSYLAPRLLYHVVGFALPAIILLYCFTCILLRLKCGSHYMQKKRALRVIVAIVLSFLISWAPYITLIINTIRSANSSDQTSCANTTALNRALTVTSALGCLNWCITPVLYAFVGGKFQKHLLV